MKILISGASGLVGTALCEQLKQHHQLIKLVRRETDSPNEISWDYRHHYIEPKIEDLQFDAVINLSGENIAAGPWTKKKKQEIVNSRTESTLFLCDIITQKKQHPDSFISASAVGFYGDRGDEILDEKSRVGSGFLADTCNEWEYCSKPLMNLGIRVSHLRIGIVLSNSGGYLAKMKSLFKLGLGSRLGHGRMYISWIDLNDLVNIFQYVLENSAIDGPVNATSPNPITNAQFTKEFAKCLHRPTFLHTPAWLLNLILGEMAKELILASLRVKPQKLLDNGFKFRYPTINDSLQNQIKGITNNG